MKRYVLGAVLAIVAVMLLSWMLGELLRQRMPPKRGRRRRRR